MSNIFCTACGYSVEPNTAFCDNCGTSMNAADGSNTHVELQSSVNLNGVAPNNTALMQKGRALISGWVMPFNSALIFGSTLIAVFDFLSPRIALLPIAATIAIVVLIGTVLLRKFFAPHLPDGNTLKTLLAPQASMHRSPVIVAGAMLSVLMVSGAAWSSVNSAEGGFIASKFDVARVAQMQVGILQSMQKEQRQQTGVLEDIREGRAADPRRELSNIGGGFNDDELDAALDRGDSRTVQLLLAGGLKWRVANIYSPFEKNNSKMSTLLLENMTSFELRAGDCERLVEQKLGTNQQFELVGGVMQPPIALPGSSSSELKPFQKKLLKTFCAQPEFRAFATDKLQSEQKLSNLAKASKQKKQLELISSREICVANTLAVRPSKLRQQQFNRQYRFGCTSSDCSYSGDRLYLAAHDAEKYRQVVQSVCLEEFPIVEANGSFNRDMTVVYQQILNSIN